MYFRNIRVHSICKRLYDAMLRTNYLHSFLGIWSLYYSPPPAVAGSNYNKWVLFLVALNLKSVLDETLTDNSTFDSKFSLSIDYLYSRGCPHPP